MTVDREWLENQIPYYLTQPQKQGLKIELENFKEGRVGPFFISNFHDEMLQGDCWKNLPIIDFLTENRRRVKGVVLSNTCDVSLGNKRDAPSKMVFAPLVSLEKYKQLLKQNGIDDNKIENKLSAIRDQTITNIFYVPCQAPLSEEFIVLLDDLHAVPIDFYDQQCDKGKVFTLSMIGFYLFVFKISIHFCRFHEKVNRVV